MDEEQIEHSLEAASVVAVGLPLLLVTAVALRWVFRLLMTGDALAREACRRWGSITGLVAALVWAAAHVVAVPNELPLTFSIVALDCWLVTLVVPSAGLPPAIARSARNQRARSASR